MVWLHCNDRASSSHPDVDLLLSLEPEELAVKLRFLVRKRREAMLPCVTPTPGLNPALLGVKLIREAFKPESGPLTDPAADGGEQVARTELFAGAIGATRTRIHTAISTCTIRLKPWRHSARQSSAPYRGRTPSCNFSNAISGYCVTISKPSSYSRSCARPFAFGRGEPYAVLVSHRDRRVPQLGLAASILHSAAAAKSSIIRVTV
jgi:hypothetical protein